MKYYDFATTSLDEAILRKFSKLMIEATNDALSDPEAIAHLGYSEPEGDEGPRAVVAEFLSAEFGEQVAPETIFLSNGASYEISVLGSDAILPKECKVLMEDVTDPLARKIFTNDLHRDIVEIPLKENGVDLNSLEKTLHTLWEETERRFPFLCAFFCTTAFHNPTAICYSEDVMRRLVHLAKRYRMLIIADDEFILSHFEKATRRRRLRSYAIEEGCEEFVASVGSFSKFLCPVLSFGWIEASEEILEKLCSTSVALGAGCLGQYPSLLLSKAIHSNRLQAHVDWIRQHFKIKCQFAIASLREHMPSEFSLKAPEGGIFLWIQLPPGWSSEEFSKFSREKYNLHFLPESHFDKKGVDSCIRFSIGPQTEEEFKTGMFQFCKMIKDFQRFSSNNLQCA